MGRGKAVREDALPGFISRWFGAFGRDHIKTTQLIEAEIIPVDLADKTPRGVRLQLGKFLRKIEGRKFSVGSEEVCVRRVGGDGDRAIASWTLGA